MNIKKFLKWKSRGILLKTKSTSWMIRIFIIMFVVLLLPIDCFGADPDIPLSYKPEMKLQEGILYYEGRDGKNYAFTVQDGTTEEWDGTFIEENPRAIDWVDGTVVDRIKAGDQQFEIIYREADNEFGYYLDFCQNGISVLPEQMVVKHYTVCGQNEDMIALVCKEKDQWYMVGAASTFLIDSSGNQTLISQDIVPMTAFVIGNGDTLLFEQEVDVNTGTQLCYYDLITNEIIPMKVVTKNKHSIFAITGAADSQSLFVYGEEKHGISYWKLLYDDTGRLETAELQEQALPHTKPSWMAVFKPYEAIIASSCLYGFYALAVRGWRRWQKWKGVNETPQNEGSVNRQFIGGMVLVAICLGVLLTNRFAIRSEIFAVVLLQWMVYWLIRKKDYSSLILQQLQTKKLLITFICIALLLLIPLPLVGIEKILSIFLIGDLITLFLFFRQEKRDEEKNE